MNFRAYEETFSGLTLEELRLAPNVLDILESEEARSGEQAGAGSGKQSWDIFLSYNHLDSQLAIRSGEVEHPPSYGSLVKEATDPRAIKERLEAEGYRCVVATCTISQQHACPAPLRQPKGLLSLSFLLPLSHKHPHCAASGLTQTFPTLPTRTLCTA